MGEATARPDKVCGFHFFYPASVMRLIEAIEGDETSDETLQAAANFAQAIRKTAIRCGEVPGFVVNRILNSSASEVWRVTEEEGLEIEEVDRIIKESGATPMGPYYLTDLLGLDTVLHVAEHLRDSYGDRFYVSSKMKELVEAGTSARRPGGGSMSTASVAATETLVERMGLKTLVESCLVLEEGVAAAKDIEIGMMMGAGILPGPFTRADEAGLDGMLESLERAQREWGDALRAAGAAPPAGGAGKARQEVGPGSSPTPQPDAGDQRETVLLETRGEVGIAWLNRPRPTPCRPRRCAI